MSVKVVLSDRFCACGCGEYTSTTAQFKRGHHNRTSENRQRNGLRSIKLGRSVCKTNGYARVSRAGVLKSEHIEIAERVLGRSLPAEAQVHHVDGVRSNNAHLNLVICPNQAYHRLLHMRADALNACGHPDWRKCGFCKKWDAPENLRFIGQRHLVIHNACMQEKNRLRVRRKAT